MTFKKMYQKFSINNNKKYLEMTLKGLAVY